MSNCQYRYENYGSYLRTRGNDAELCNLRADVNDLKKLVSLLIHRNNAIVANDDIDTSTPILVTADNANDIKYWNIAPF